ncbi:hypothetical protein RvY_15134 [Ramazzottius varieornatus]|uniref:Uncharacterized protein n=1 Tax=Ramazzottius varieornatus TaxID=947166 RepID=A0A1D1W0T7_RAMVA|nr:hypothetical protein RvY_15134 [Ramazzottius varieornatus]
MDRCGAGQPNTLTMDWLQSMGSAVLPFLPTFTHRNSGHLNLEKEAAYEPAVFKMGSRTQKDPRDLG